MTYRLASGTPGVKEDGVFLRFGGLPYCYNPVGRFVVDVYNLQHHYTPRRGKSQEEMHGLGEKNTPIRTAPAKEQTARNVVLPQFSHTVRHGYPRGTLLILAVSQVHEYNFDELEHNIDDKRDYRHEYRLSGVPE